MLRAGPGVLSGRIAPALALAALAIALPELLLAADEFDPRVLAYSLAVAVFFLLAMPWLIARMAGHIDRYPQALTGLALADLALLPVVILVFHVFNNLTTDLAAWWLPLLLLVLAALGWMIALRTRIWRFLTGAGSVRSGGLAIILIAFEIWASSLVA